MENVPSVSLSVLALFALGSITVVSQLSQPFDVSVKIALGERVGRYEFRSMNGIPVTKDTRKQKIAQNRNSVTEILAFNTFGNVPKLFAEHRKNGR